MNLYLPKQIVYRKKRGFAIPLNEWIKDFFSKDLLDDDDIINMEYIRKMYQEFLQGKKINIYKLWFVLVYKLWRANED